MTPARKRALQLLEKAVADGTVGQFRNLDSEFGHGMGIHAKRAYNGSLDAAKVLHDAVLPGYRWGRQWSEHAWVEIADIPGRSDRYYGENSDPARAWLIAIIRALHGDRT